MNVSVAATQMACRPDRAANIARAESLVSQAAGRGANVVLVQELFETPCFCQDHRSSHFDTATPVEENPAVHRMAALALELG